MTIGWECPVCHKGCAPQALKCEHCAESKLAYRPPSPNAELIGPGLWPSPESMRKGHFDRMKSIGTALSDEDMIMWNRPSSSTEC